MKVTEIRFAIITWLVFSFLLGSKSALADITAADAANHVGEQAVVCGVVASAKYAETVRKSPTFLNLDRPYPNQIFTAVIWGIDRGGFKTAPEELQGQSICVSGAIEDYKGRPEIIVHSPKQISAKANR